MRLSKKIIQKNIDMIYEYYHDYKSYKKWNYNNPSVKTQNAMEAKILRQTHVIEKGLSLSAPRKGFGVAKINELMDMLDRYLELGFSSDDIPFQNAISVMKSYIAFQNKVDYSNPELFSRIETFYKYEKADFEGGIRRTTLSELKTEMTEDFPHFFSSRHSLRQFSKKDIDVEDIKEAVRIAQKAPSACNRQATKVYYYSDMDKNNKLGELIAGNTGFDKDVKAYLVLTGDMSAFYDAFERNQLYVEGGMFAMALMEALHYKGIASCALQNGEFYKKNKKFKDICENIPDSERIILFIAIGYYKDEFDYAISNRKKLDKVLVVEE